MLPHYQRDFTQKKPPFIFFHIPKTGGSSISAALKRHYRLSHFNIRLGVSSHEAEALFSVDKEADNYLECRQTLRSSLVFYAAMQGVRFITGHFWYHDNMLRLKERGYCLVVLLRHPVDRFFSQYFYNRFKEGTYARINEGFEAFLTGREGKTQGCLYVQFIGGPRQDHNYASDQAVDSAKQRLDAFDVIGFLEHLSQFRHKMLDHFGIRLNIPHKRRSPARKKKPHRVMMTEYRQSDEYRRRVANVCAPDMELYHYALKRSLA
jgi:hypothetical protein